MDLEPAQTIGRIVSKDFKKDFGRMYVFYHVAKSGSFTKAARHLGMSRTMIMQTVQGLEEAFGVRLFNRTTRSFSLTEQGERLFMRATKMHREFEEACAEMQSEASEAQGKITLQIPGVLDLPELHGMFARFLEENPRVTFDVVNADRVGDLVERKVDVALHVGPLEDSSYHAKILFHFDTYILGSPAYFAKHKAPRHPSELERHKCLNYRHCLTGDKWVFLNPDTKHYQTFPLGSTTTVDSERMLVSLAEAGHGIASALDISCADALASGALLPVLQDWTYQIPLYLVYISKKSMPRSLRAFIDMLTEQVPAKLGRQGPAHGLARAVDHPPSHTPPDTPPHTPA